MSLCNHLRLQSKNTLHYVKRLLKELLIVNTGCIIKISPHKVASVVHFKAIQDSNLKQDGIYIRIALMYKIITNV